MDTLVLIIGGNLGNRHQNILDANQRMEKIFGTTQMKSAIYETGAWGGKSTGYYLNQVLVFRVGEGEQAILKSIQQIEEEMGRTRNVKWGDRTMDIDILFLSDKVINSPELQIPHPYIHKRKFVLKPLCDILPDFIHPVFKKSIRELLLECSDGTEVQVFKKK